jgi:hypothetical protein
LQRSALGRETERFEIDNALHTDSNRNHERRFLDDLSTSNAKLDRFRSEDWLLVVAKLVGSAGSRRSVGTRLSPV